MKRIVIAVLFVSLAFFVYAGGGDESSSGELAGEVNLFAWLPDNPDIVVNWVDKFEALYPDITVNTQMMTGNTLLENMQPRFASNTMPDGTATSIPTHRTRPRSRSIPSVRPGRWICPK